jgi:serine/threonine protein kinase
VNELVTKTGYRIASWHTILNESVSLASEHVIIVPENHMNRKKFFVKIARTCGDSGRILREINVLRRLKELEVDNIPEIVLSGTSQGRAYLVENYIEQSKNQHLTENEMFNYILEWLGKFYLQTKEGTIEPKQIVHRAEEVANLAKGFVDLTDSLYILEKSAPNTAFPAVCRHGDITENNFVLSNRGIIGIDFGFSRFNEPPSEPYAMVCANKLGETAKSLDVLSQLNKINPFFLAMYENITRLGEELEMLNELEKNLSVINRIRYFVPQVQLWKIEQLRKCYQELDFKA